MSGYGGIYEGPGGELFYGNGKPVFHANVKAEPEGERLRTELIEWLTRNKIVGIELDTEKHEVHIRHRHNLPPHIEPVLTQWGSIYVEVDDSKSEELK